MLKNPQTYASRGWLFVLSNVGVLLDLVGIMVCLAPRQVGEDFVAAILETRSYVETWRLSHFGRRSKAR